MAGLVRNTVSKRVREYRAATEVIGRCADLVGVGAEVGELGEDGEYVSAFEFKIGQRVYRVIVVEVEE